MALPPVFIVDISITRKVPEKLIIGTSVQVFISASHLSVNGILFEGRFQNGDVQRLHIVCS
jgi:hypothetical protein